MNDLDLCSLNELNTDVVEPTQSNLGLDLGNEKNVTESQITNKTIEKPIQPILNFPANKNKRKFQAKWYKEFNWIEYNATLDAAFCFICKQFPIKASEKSTFKSTGFKDWHNAKSVLQLHQRSESHITNSMLLSNRVFSFYFYFKNE